MNRDGPSKAASGSPDLETRYRESRRVTLIGSVLDLLLGVLKIIGGVLGHSQALVADGVHSLSDLATDVLVILAARHANVDADDAHPYGHARIETAATVGLGVLLVTVGIGITLDAVRRLMIPDSLEIPAIWGLAIAFFSVVSKEWIYRYTMKYARKLRSNMLRANAWHSRTDAFSSVVVIVGIGGAQMGFAYLDAVAALVVAAMIAKIGFDLAWSSLQELIDTGLEPEQLDDIRETILSVGGVRDLHELRTRQMGGKALVDVHIILEDPTLSVSEGHHISENVRQRLIRRIDHVEDVMVHIDPEDDEIVVPSENLEMRRQILERLGKRWRAVDAAGAIRRVTLHYLDGRVHVELELPLKFGTDAESLTRAFNEAVRGEEDIAGVRLVFSDAHQNGALSPNAH